jgi:hypothetical protein
MHEAKAQGIYMVSKAAKYLIYYFVIMTMFFTFASGVSLGATPQPSKMTSDGSLPCLPAMALPLLVIGVSIVGRMVRRRGSN